MDETDRSNIEVYGVRILFYTIGDKFMFTLRMSTGEDGWLWYHDVNDLRFSNLFAIFLVEGERYHGIGINFLMFNLAIAKKKASE